MRRQVGRNLIREELIERLTIGLSLPGINPICTCSSCIIIKSTFCSLARFFWFGW